MITIKTIPNVLSYNDRTEIQVNFDPLKELSDYVSIYDLADQKIIIDGAVVTDMSKYVEDGAEIIITPDIKEPISFLANVIFYAAAYAYLHAGTIMTIAALAATGYSIYSAVTSKPRKANHGMVSTGGIEDGSPTYGYNIASSMEYGVPVGIVLGKHRTGGNIINQYISSDGNKNYLNVLISYGEGEAESIDDILIDENPLSNYQGITIEKRYGTADQTVIPYFNQVHNVNEIGIQISQGNSYTYTTVKNDIDAFQLNAECPNGLFFFNMYNQLRSISVEYKVEYKLHTSADWINLGTQIFSGQNRSAVRHVFRKDGLSPGTYDIRVTKISGDSNLELPGGGSSTTDFYLKSVDEITDESLPYPNTVLLGLKLLATEQLNGPTPNITSVIKRKFRQPKIMNGVNEVVWADYYWDPDYDSGAGAYRLFSDNTVLSWDGSSYVYKYCSNPIWIMRDLLTNSRYGLGDFINTLLLDETQLLQMSRYCEERVSNGSGGYEKRFELNAVLDSSTKALDTIIQLCAAFRGMPFYSSGAILMKIDKPELPVQQFGMGNIIEGSFTETWTSKKEIPNEIEVQFMNEENNYKQESIYIEDPASLNAGEPRRKKTIRLLCTKSSQAYREGKYALNIAKYCDRMITFKTAINAVELQPCDLIRYSHDVPQIGFSGRVLAGTVDTVTVDREITIEAGKTYKIIITHADNITEERTVTNLPGTYILLGVDSNFSQAPAEYDVYSFGESNKVVELFRVVNFKKDNNFEVEITAIKYNPDVYNDSVTLPVVNYSSLRADVPAVTNIVLSEAIVKTKSGSIENRIDVYFAKPQNPGDFFIRAYEKARVYLSRDAGTNWEYQGETYGDYFSIINDLRDLESYRIAVVSVSKDGAANQIGSSPQANITLVGKTAPPADITYFEVQQIGPSLKFIWTPPPDVDFAFARIKKGNDWSNAVTVIERGDVSEITLPVTEIGVQNYLCKAVDTSGNESANASMDTIDVKLRDTSRFIAEFELMSYSNYLNTSNIDFGFRRDNRYSSARKYFALSTAQTWEEFLAAAGTWESLSLNIDAEVLETSGSAEMRKPVDLGVISEFKIIVDPEYYGSSNTSLEIQTSTSEDNITYSAYSALSSSTIYRARYVKFNINLSTTNNLQNIFVYGINFVFESQDTKRTYGRDVLIPAAGKTILYGDTYNATPSITATIINGTVGFPVIESKTLTQFTIKVYNLSGVAIQAEIDWFATGV